MAVASRNIRIFSSGSRDDAELARVADCLEPYGLVAVQELLRVKGIGEKTLEGIGELVRVEQEVEWMAE